MYLPALDLVNSEHWPGHGPHVDLLLLPQTEWLERFLEHWDLGAAGNPSQTQLRALLRLRSLLRRMITTLDAGDLLFDEDLDELNRFLAHGAVIRRLSLTGGQYEVEIAPVRRDWPWVLAEIAATFAALVTSGELARVKLCANPECRFAFYDETKNRSRRWCAPVICGNRFKVRQFRARQRALRERRSRD